MQSACQEFSKTTPVYTFIVVSEKKRIYSPTLQCQQIQFKVWLTGESLESQNF